MKLPEKVREYFRKKGAEGGNARAANLSGEQRREIARQAAQTRWAEERKKSAQSKTAKNPKTTRGGK